MFPSASTALRLGPGNFPTPLLSPSTYLLIVGLGFASFVHSAWTAIAPPLLDDPRPEVRRFVHAVRAREATSADLAALMAYRKTLSEGEREALAYEVNYLLFRDGQALRVAFSADGEIIELPPGVTVASVAAAGDFNGPIVFVSPDAQPRRRASVRRGDGD